MIAGMMEARLLEFFKQKEWPDAELHVLLPPGSAADGEGSSATGSGSTTLVELPVHRILLSGSEVFKAQVRLTGATVHKLGHQAVIAQLTTACHGCSCCAGATSPPRACLPLM
jgi:hypothetical protein